nr:MAG TPA: hypothetical protein [Cressdnaviricota sp.]
MSAVSLVKLYKGNALRHINMIRSYQRMNFQPDAVELHYLEIENQEEKKFDNISSSDELLKFAQKHFPHTWENHLKMVNRLPNGRTPEEQANYMNNRD